MTKRQLIDEIVSMNQTADPEFLSQFKDQELDNYLEHLRFARKPRLSGDRHRYDKYFESPTVKRSKSADKTENAQKPPPEEDIAAAAAKAMDDKDEPPFANGKDNAETWLFE